MDDCFPVLVFGDVYGWVVVVPGGDVRSGVVGAQGGVHPGIDEGIALVLLLRRRGVVDGLNVQGSVGDNGLIIIADGCRGVEGKVIGVMASEYGVEAYDGVCDVDAVAFADILQGQVGTFEAVVQEIAGLGFLLYHFYIIELEAVDGGAVPKDTDAVEYDLLKLGCERHGDLGAVLHTGFVGDIADVVGVFGLAVEVALEVVEGVIVTVADVVPGWFFLEVRVGGEEPTGERAGLYIWKGLQFGGKQDGQDDGQCDAHGGKIQIMRRFCHPVGVSKDKKKGPG